MSGVTSPVPWRIAFDSARDPYTARNALGITSTGGGGSGFITAVTPPLQVTGTTLSIDLSGYQPLDADLTAIAALTGTDMIYYRSAADTWSPVTIGANLTFTGGTLAASGGGGGTPGGATTQVQYNNAGAFGGAANLTWNNGTSVLTVTGQVAIPLGNATSVLAGGVVESGAGFKQTGSVAYFAPATTAGIVSLRPNGLTSSTGQVQISTTSVTMTMPVTLPADPTANLQAATKQYVDARITPCPQPQGRLTLQTATPVMTTSQMAKTTIFYTPYCGNKVALYDGSTLVSTTFAELSNITTASSTGNAGPAAVAASSVYDLFVWSNAGTVTLTRGPAWTSDTARSAGTALVMVNGILLNNAAITNGPAAARGTYVGTMRSNASSQLDWIYGAAASGGTAGFFGVWNCYNRLPVSTIVSDTTGTWTHSVATTWRAPNGNATMRVQLVIGLNEDPVLAAYHGQVTCGTGMTATTGIGLDSTTSPSGIRAQSNAGGTSVVAVASYHGLVGLGFHFLSALERNSGTTANTWTGLSPNDAQSGLAVDFWG